LGERHGVYQGKIFCASRLKAAFEVHELHGKVNEFGGRIGLFGLQYILLAQDREAAVDGEPRALIRIGYDAIADHQPFAGLQLDLERHRFAFR